MMRRNRLIMVAAGILVIVGLPIVGKLSRGHRDAGCALDGVKIDPAFRVRIVAAQSKDHEFCCIRCAEYWLNHHRQEPLAIYLTDERTGQEIRSDSAQFVRSSVNTTPSSGNRIHVFQNNSDARDHAAQFGGTVLEGSDRPFAASQPIRLDGTPREIVPGVYYLGDIVPTAVYAITGPEGIVLIDSGVPFFVPKVLSTLSDLGLNPEQLRAVLLTHRHLDHASGAATIRETTGARIYAGGADAMVLEQSDSIEDFLSFFPLEKQLPVRFLVDEHIDRTGDLSVAGIDLRAIVCPGHTAGSVCYVLRRAGRTVLFSGDTVMTLEGNPGTFGLYYDARYGADPDDYLSTLESLREIPVDVLLPGHPHLDNKPTPLVRPDGWHKLVDQGIAETRTLIERYRRDGRAFLNGVPRALSPGLLYLGDFSDSSTFALQSEDGIVIVDPPGPECMGALFEHLGDLGGRTEQIRGILLTAVSPENLECTREIGRRTDALVGRPSGGVPAGDEETIVTGGEELTIGGFRFQVQATPAPARDAVTYLVPIGGQLAAFTGDSIWAPASEPFLDQYSPAPPASLREVLYKADDDRIRLWLASLDALAREPVTLWLPRHPVRAQNAFLYDRRWESVLRAQQTILRATLKKRF